MPEEKYRVAITGGLAEGADSDAARQLLSELFDVPAERVDRLLEGKRVPLPRELPPGEAEALRGRLESAGIPAELEPVESLELESIPEPAPAEREGAGEPSDAGTPAEPASVESLELDSIPEPMPEEQEGAQEPPAAETPAQPDPVESLELESIPEPMPEEQQGAEEPSESGTPAQPDPVESLELESIPEPMPEEQERAEEPSESGTPADPESVESLELASIPEPMPEEQQGAQERPEAETAADSAELESIAEPMPAEQEGVREPPEAESAGRQDEGGEITEIEATAVGGFSGSQEAHREKARAAELGVGDDSSGPEAGEAQAPGAEPPEGPDAPDAGQETFVDTRVRSGWRSEEIEESDEELPPGLGKAKQGPGPVLIAGAALGILAAAGLAAWLLLGGSDEPATASAPQSPPDETMVPEPAAEPPATGPAGDAQRQLGDLARSVKLWMIQFGVGYDPTQVTLDRLQRDLGITQSQLEDPWGNPVRYQASRDQFEVFSAGPDGRFGSADDLVHRDKL